MQYAALNASRASKCRSATVTHSIAGLTRSSPGVPAAASAQRSDAATGSDQAVADGDGDRGTAGGSAKLGEDGRHVG